VYLSAEGLARLREEHRELTESRRPEVIGRIKSAKELGDLKENADYTAAREEQSFVEGRIATIEALLRDATVIEAPAAGADGRIDLGSRVSVEETAAPGEVTVYEIVGSAEADPAAGRISNASPVGRALIGARVGETVTVRTPRGDVRYRIATVE
jgi:transcription elongation factor GreA